MVRSDASCLALEKVEDMPGLSDHKSLLYHMTISLPSKAKRIVTSRSSKAMSLSDFQANVKCFAHSLSQCSEADLAGVYNAGQRVVLGRHAPLITGCVSQRPSAPLLTEEIRAARRRRRRAERRSTGRSSSRKGPL